ncbi:hypothetical protein [Microbacterium aurum]
MDAIPTTERLRAWAKGSFPLEAAVELLIRAGKDIHAGSPWIIDYGEGNAGVDPDRLLHCASVWSGGEQRVARIAASLSGGERVDLSNEICGLHRDQLEMVLAAFAHANGSHEHSCVVRNHDGCVVGFERLASLYPWPEAAERR